MYLQESSAENYQQKSAQRLELPSVTSLDSYSSVKPNAWFRSSCFATDCSFVVASAVHMTYHGEHPHLNTQYWELVIPRFNNSFTQSLMTELRV